MLKYPSGDEIAIGDSVSIMHGSKHGVVEEIVATVEQATEWGLAESGVTLLAAPFGRVFYPASCFEEECLFLVSRSTIE